MAAVRRLLVRTLLSLCSVVVQSQERNIQHRQGTMVLSGVPQRVLVQELVALKQGKVVFEGPPSALMREEVLASIYDMQIRIVDIQGRRIGVHYE